MNVMVDSEPKELEELTLDLEQGSSQSTLSHSKDIKRNILKRRFYVALIVFFIVLNIALLTTVLALSIKTYGDNTSTITYENTTKCHLDMNMPGKGQQTNIVATREYQVKLKMTDWYNRTDELPVYLQAISAVSSLNINTDDIENYIHNEYKLEDNKCNVISGKAHFRVRHYYEAPKKSPATTIDIKYPESESFDEVYALPYWPVDQLAKDSSQKCEQDMHYCSSKYSRETRISFPHFDKNFTTCGDLVSIFPWAMSLQNTELIYPTPQAADAVYWWIGKNSGYLAGDTKYEIEFTLQYTTLERAAKQPSHPSYGEWSIRIFAKQDGLSADHEFDPKGVAEAEAIWHAVLALPDKNQCDSSDSPV